VAATLLAGGGGQRTPDLNTPLVAIHDHGGAHQGGGRVWSLSENQRGELLCATVAANLMVGGGKPGQGYPAVLIAETPVAPQAAGVASAADRDGTACPPSAPVRAGGDNDELAVSGTLTARVGKGPSSTADDGALVLQPTAASRPASPSGAMAAPASPPASTSLQQLARPGPSESGGGAMVTVRRLTPTECERLQGFPDNWTAVDAAGQPLSDTARYRFMGNAATVPVVAWIAARLQAAHHASSALQPTPPLPPTPSQEDSPD
jgi:DNA (cytosine-5)-methyltransferase 1